MPITDRDYYRDHFRKPEPEHRGVPGWLIVGLILFLLLLVVIVVVYSGR